MAPLAWVDGEVMPAEKAKVPLEDRGVLFGEAVYEALITRDGIAFARDPHLERLERSAAGIGLDPAQFRARVAQAVDDLLARGRGDGLLYLQVTGGAGPRDHLPPPGGLEPGVFGTLRPFDRPKIERDQQRGYRAVTLPDPRWPFATWKTTQLLGNVLAKREAVARGADECLFIDREGFVLEGGSVNVFVVRGGRALTPPLTRNILPGVTRAILLEQFPDRVTEADIPASTLIEATEVFITSTTRPVVGVVNLDDRTLGDGFPGPVTRDLMEGLRRIIDGELSR
jgi:D-alanine transaminase